MIQKYNLNISPEKVETAKALISGKKKRCKLGTTMPFLFEIVDKWVHLHPWEVPPSHNDLLNRINMTDSEAHITPENIVHAAKNADLPGVEEGLVAELTVNQVIVDISKMHYASATQTVFTKEEKFMGFVQAAYRHVFRSFPIPDEQSEIATVVPTLPVNEAPSTPRTLTRPPSLGVPTTQPSRSFGRTPSLSENKFTTLPPNYQSRSPPTVASFAMRDKH
ncbi:hypothetical protein AZE42_06441 [Rhizopogon vesiculosus]|uniref:Uncharacterized protein n=1 Tax=Rhizopogon vesiculosus TaxID=180088 RepID=A0A1J8PPD3_9AGAM|nr:hypothetical protein AZE42_06441 [Rhizopogon vesiculosus]